jgi:excisionase family DNA binding protein
MIDVRKTTRTVTTRSGMVTVRLELNRDAVLALADSLGALMADLVADGALNLSGMPRATATAKPAEYITAKQLAERLGLSRQTIDSWRYQGTGPRWRKLGRVVRYSVADVDAWLAKLGR